MPQKKRINPNATFVKVTIERKQINAYIDTGATLCFAKEKVFQNWTRLDKPIRIIVADKSAHEIWWVKEYVDIWIKGYPFKTKTIYKHDSGLDLIIGNNFLKLYQPFTQTIDWISLKHPSGKTVKTEIVRFTEVLKTLLLSIKDNLVFQKQSMEIVERKLEEICSENPLDIKNTNKELVIIKLKDPLTEVDVPSKRIYSIKDVEEFTKECQELLEKGIIRHSTSPHSAPAFYVENNNEIKRGKRRMVINYKEMNKATIGDSYKLPRKDYILEKLKGKNWFSTLDAKSGYWQLRLSEETKPLTAFSCPPQKHYEWNVLPFGLKQAPSIYQRYMDANLQGLEDFCLAYIDDIIIFTAGTEKDHASKLISVLERCKEKGLVISKRKAKILQKEVEYLGMKIGVDGQLSLTSNTQEKIKAFPDKLENRKQIQRFLGCLNYISDQGFLKQFAKERKVLQKKLSEKIPFSWTESDTEVVKAIKNNIEILPVLYNPTNEDFIIIETDASKEVWAGCMLAIPNGKKLLNMDDNGNPLSPNGYELKKDNGEPSSSQFSILDACLEDKRIALDYHLEAKIKSSDDLTSYVPKTEKLQTKLCKYISGTFTKTQCNYPIHELETLACVKVLKKWRIELLPQRFELRTDSTYVKGFWKYKLQEDFKKGRLLQWQLCLQQYKPFLKHIKSENNCFADTLTREWKE